MKLRVSLLILLLVGAGCAKEAGSSFVSVGSTIARSPQASATAVTPPTSGEFIAVDPQAGEQGAGEPGGGGVKGLKPTVRKIKYTADMNIICDDFAQAEDALLKAVAAHQGLIAHSEVSAAPGAPRSGFWRVRLPIPQFDGFRAAVRQLGETEKNTADSEDLTELYYDLENHIKNKLAEEESLRKLLEKSGGEKIENILAIRRELAQVRDDINRKQGKLKVLANLTDLTTVAVTLREKQKYAPAPPPDIAETPTFGMRLGHTFNESWVAFIHFLQLVVLAVVGSLPWLALAAIVLGPFALRSRRSKRAAPPAVESSPPASSA